MNFLNSIKSSYLQKKTLIQIIQDDNDFGKFGKIIIEIQINLI